MQKRRLGSTDIEVSVIGLGTVKFGRNQGVKYPTAFSLPSDQQLRNLLTEASNLGINLLDTAPAYGQSEERLGKLLVGERERWIISTKVGEEFVDGESHFDFSANAIQKSVERSLRRLQTDYLDILLVHSNGDDVKLIEQENIFARLIELKQQGKIRAFGMSTKTIDGGLLTIDQADVAMVTFNPRQQEEHVVIDHAYSKQKGILVKKAFGGGYLATSTPIKNILHFVFSKPGVTSIVIGTINIQHLCENLAFL